jgi:hypothetical protein
LSFGRVEGYFIDMSVLMPTTTEAVAKACSGFIKSNACKCIISSSVKNQAKTLIEQSHDLIVENFHKTLKPYLQKNGIKELTNRDGRIIAEYFYDQKLFVKKNVSTLSTVLREHMGDDETYIANLQSKVPDEYLGEVETYLADRLHDLKNEEKVPVDVFLAEAALQLGQTRHDMQAYYTGLRNEEINPNEKLHSAVLVGAIMTDVQTVAHLASAIKYQFTANKWVIFVTVNPYVLEKKRELEELFLQCSKPDWAYDFFVERTKMKAPLEHIKEAKEFTNKQKSVLDALKESIQAAPLPLPSSVSSVQKGV